MTTRTEWEHEILPPFPRRRALLRLLLAPADLAIVVLGTVAIVAESRALMLITIGVGLYTLAYLRLDYWHGNGTCETEDHWLGNGEMPEGMTQTCPTCREIPIRELWRGGWR